jgi:two-component system NtrC family sensor kinase
MRNIDTQHIRQNSPAPEIFTLPTPWDVYVAAFCPITEESVHWSTISYLLLKPIEQEVRASLEPVMNAFIIVSLIVLAVTAGIGYVISRGITRPIAELVKGTTEISQGNYDYQIHVRSGGELMYLASRFQEMSQSLKEKIHQLGLRNLELEDALTRLRDAQDELMWSERLTVSGKITAQLSHELNNPIHNIYSCLQTALKRTSQDSPERELLELALEEVERLAKLTRQMLDVYRISMVQDSREPMNLNEVIEEVLRSSDQLLSESNVTVRKYFTQHLPDIAGSRDKLKQVFLNLFLNAKDAMPEGGTLSIETLHRNGSAVVTPILKVKFP